jgi:monofunctional biosynthetic peptidoglycan transglycosylase
MEVYLNVAETGLGTYGFNAGSSRYYGHDASAMSATEAARIAAVLPLPKERGAIAPKGFTRRYGNIIAARIGSVGRDRLDACVYTGIKAPVNRAPPPSRKAPSLPGSEYERVRVVAPPPREVIDALPPATDLPAPEAPVPDLAPPSLAPPEVPAEPDNGVVSEADNAI